MDSVLRLLTAHLYRVGTGTAIIVAVILVPGAPSGHLAVAERETLDEVPAPPESPPLERAMAWRDQGRPAAALEGVEETMRRLRAQGYL